MSASGAPGTCYPNSATWSFSAGVWTSQVAGIGPSPRLLSSSAFDATDHVLVLFGGATSGSASACAVSATTWSYVGGSWTNLSGSIAVPPPARDSAAMTFDGAEGVVLLFGGSEGGLLLNDTWVYPAQINGSATSNTGNASSAGNGTTGGVGSGGSGGTGTNNSTGGDSGWIPPFSIGYTLSSVTSTGPLTVTFVGTAIGGIGPFSFSWYFGDSTPTVNGSTVSHRYTHPGSYEPVLTATDATGSVIVRVLASITIAPVPTTGTVLPPSAPSGPSPGAISVGFLGLGSIVLVALVVVYGRKEWRLSREGRSLVGDFE